MKQYSEYKDSGVKWIGDIPSHWEMRKMKSYCEITDGTHDTPDYVEPNNNTYPLVTSRCIVNGKLDISIARHISKQDFVIIDKRSHVSKFDIIMPMIGTVGNPTIVKTDEPIAIKNVALFRMNNDLNKSKFLWYMITSKIISNQFDMLINGGVLTFVSQQIIKKLLIVFPTLPEQQAIVSYLDAKVAKIDSYIATATKKIAALDELKQVTIANAVTKGINPNAPMKDSGIPWIGMVPENWEVKRTAIMFSENKDKNSKYEFSHAFKFNYGTLIPKNETGEISEYRETYEAYTIIKKDDIAINCLNLNYDFVSQRVAISPNIGILTSAYLIITPRQGVNPYYYNYLFKSMDSKKMFHGMGTGIRLTLSYTELKKQFLPVPPLSEQTEIVAYIDRKVAQIDQMRTAELSQIEKLKEYKQRLISDVVTGKVKVTND